MLVSGSTIEIELGRFRGILRAEFDRLVDVLILADMAATDVKSLLGRKGIFLTVDDHHAVALTAVHDTEFTVVEEILLLDARIHVETQLQKVLQFQSFVHWHCTTEDETVVV